MGRPRYAKGRYDPASEGPSNSHEEVDRHFDAEAPAATSTVALAPMLSRRPRDDSGEQR